MNSKIFELTPIYDKRKSFYRKAIVTENCTFLNGLNTDSIVNADGEKHLYSYGEHVAYIDKDNKVHLLMLWHYSDTTLRHVKEFLKQSGFKADTKKQIEKDYANY